MNRRSFLKAITGGLAATAALATVDPEFLLWRPGAKSIFIPEPPQPLAFHPDVFSIVTADLKVGDVFTIDGYMAPNPKTGRSLGIEQRFVVTAVAGATVGIKPFVPAFRLRSDAPKFSDYRHQRAIHA